VTSINVNHRKVIIWTIVIGYAVLLTGCRPDRTADRFIPPTRTARQALEAALQSWREGRPAGKVEGTSPQVYVVDTCRRPDQTLKSFTILGETAGEGPRCLAVRLRLDHPEEEQRARFVVFGVEPLWVYRYEDYEMMIHWACSGNEDESKNSSSQP
jgi:hypothetical protein